MYFCTSHQFYLQKKKREKFRIPVLSTATGIRDDLFSPESLGKGLFFAVLSSHEKPSWLALLNRVSLIGILEFRCRVTGAEWILFSSFFSLPVSREAIVVVLTGISHHAKRWFFNSLFNFLLFLKYFFVCFYFSFESFSLKITLKISKTAQHRKYVHTFESWSEMTVFFQWLWKRISS